MDPATKQAASAAIIRCKGYSRAMADNLIATLEEAEIVALARAARPVLRDKNPTGQYEIVPGGGEYVALISDEIADRKALAEAEADLAEAEKEHEKRPLDQQPAKEAIRRRTAAAERRAALEASRQRRTAHALEPAAPHSEPHAEAQSPQS